MYTPPITEPDEYGLVWDDPSHHTLMGFAIFDTVEHRGEAIDWLQELGFRYLVTYKDVHGAGLIWAERPSWPEYTIRRSRRDRLPSHRQSTAVRRRGPSLYRNPAYDSINDPDPRYTSRW